MDRFALQTVVVDLPTADTYNIKSMLNGAHMYLWTSNDLVSLLACYYMYCISIHNRKVGFPPLITPTLAGVTERMKEVRYWPAAVAAVW